MKLRRLLSNLWISIQKGIEIQAYTDLYVKGGISREEYISELDRIEKRYE